MFEGVTVADEEQRRASDASHTLFSVDRPAEA
jgi:hypothetical protein